MKAPMERFCARGKLSPPSPANIFILISTAILPTGARITRPRQTKSGSRPPGASRISWPGLGTSGTFVGTTRRLKELNPAIRCISLQPDASFHGLEGWKHMATAIVPAIYDATLADANLDSQHRRGVSPGQAGRAGRGIAAEPERRRRSRRLFSGGRVARAGRARRDRDDFPGFRHKIFERAFLGRSLGRAHLL